MLDEMTYIVMSASKYFLNMYLVSEKFNILVPKNTLLDPKSKVP